MMIEIGILIKHLLLVIVQPPKMRSSIIQIIPQNMEHGTVTISITFDDGGETITSSFDLHVYASELVHHGWKNIKALGLDFLAAPIAMIMDSGSRRLLICKR